MAGADDETLAHLAATPDGSISESTSAPGAGLAQPIVYQDELIGVLTAWQDAGSPPFTVQDLDTLGLFATQAAVAIRNAALYEAVAESNQALEMTALRANELAVAATAAWSAYNFEQRCAEIEQLLPTELPDGVDGRLAELDRVSTALRELGGLERHLV